MPKTLIPRYWPIDAPGMPEPGPNFVKMAEEIAQYSNEKNLKKIVTQLYTQALREPGFLLTIDITKGVYRQVETVPGHIWDHPTADGPRPAEVFVIGKCLGREEAAQQRCFVGPSGKYFREELEKIGLYDCGNWYVTNVVHFGLPTRKSTLHARWLRDSAILLAMELRIVRPKYIICLGADSTRMVLGKGYSVTNMDGRVVEITVDCRLREDQEITEETMQKISVMSILHPVEVLRDAAKERVFINGIRNIRNLISGVSLNTDSTTIDHRHTNNYETACRWLDEEHEKLAKLPFRERLVAWDAEWHGSRPRESDSYLRTIQISCAEGHARAFVISNPGGSPAFVDNEGKPAFAKLKDKLNKFMHDKRAVGHFFVADLEWLHAYGINPIAKTRLPIDYDNSGKPPWEQMQDGAGWIDTAMLFHAIEETAVLGLEALATRYTTVPRYDIDFEKYKTKFCQEHGIKKNQLKGYGEFSNEALIPYANYDADTTMRLARCGLKLLDNDYYGNNCWQAFWETMITLEPILEMRKNGLLIDKERIEKLTEVFIAARDSLQEYIRQTANWPDFNLRSLHHVCEFFFGEEYNPKTEDGQIRRFRPPEAISLKLQPVLDTGKPAKLWEEIVAKNLQNESTPATNKQALSLLIAKNDDPAVQQILIAFRDYRFLDQVVKTVLRPPKCSDNGEYVSNEDGELIYEKGLGAAIDSDSRIRTHLLPTTETGRWRSSRPNLQNLSKSRDEDYAKILGKNYNYKIRSCVVAPEDYYLVEADYVGAELRVAALLANDPNMIDHTERSSLPDSGYDKQGNPTPDGKYPHPKYYDIHSNIAKKAFQLDCPPTKNGLKNYLVVFSTTSGIVTDIGDDAGIPWVKVKPNNEPEKVIVYRGHKNEPILVAVGDSVHEGQPLIGTGRTKLRTLAKTVIFGLMYGSSAKSIALQASMGGVKDITAEIAQDIIDTVFSTYPNLERFFAACRRRVIDPGWIVNPFGRYRRFPRAEFDKTQIGELERQAMNFPIQSTVASCIDRATAKILQTVKKFSLNQKIKLLLTVHDAILLEVHKDYVHYTKNDLLPYAMKTCVPIYPKDLSGRLLGTNHYYLDIETEVMRRWGEKLSNEERKLIEKT